MARGLRWRLTSKQVVVVVGIIVAVVAAVVVYRLTRINYGCDWTGFGECARPKSDAIELRPEKTLWDWLGLLLIPLVLAGGGFLFSWREKRYELRIAEERANEAALQAYLDQMTTLLLDKNLRASQPDAEVRAVARARTLTVLRRLDKTRRITVLRFLIESDLIDPAEAIINLIGADLRGYDLSGANLGRANLTGVNLRGANLAFAILHRANLAGADLERATLAGAELAEANLDRANLVGATLAGADVERAFLGAIYDSTTRWPDNVDPVKCDAIHVDMLRYKRRDGAPLERPGSL